MFETYFSIIASLFIIEVLLSVDNALVNATLANSLPEQKRKQALRIGILAGAGFRIVALFLAAFIIQNVWLKLLGGLYLVYLATNHLGKTLNEKGEVHKPKETFFGIITQIAIADLVFSIDNVISAVSFSSNLFIVMLGVGIGVISMLFITPILARLVHTYKGMPQAAYGIVGFVGLALCIETLSDVHITEMAKFTVVLTITLFTIAYEHSVAVRWFSNPILKKSQYLIALPLAVLYGVRDVLIRLFKTVV
jgi:YkoY family integral membrane protein